MAEKGFNHSFWFLTVSENYGGICCYNCVVTVPSLVGWRLISGSKAEHSSVSPSTVPAQACEAQPVSLTPISLSPSLPPLLSPCYHFVTESLN